MFPSKQKKEEPTEGIEPSAFRLQSGCSATKLYWLNVTNQSTKTLLKHMTSQNITEINQTNNKFKSYTIK